MLSVFSCFALEGVEEPRVTAPKVLSPLEAPAPKYDPKELKTKLQRLKQQSKIKPLNKSSNAADLATPRASNASHLVEEVHDDLVALSSISFGQEKEHCRDFDSNPTELYTMLHKKKWKSAMARIKEAHEEAAMWIYRHETKHDSGEIRWRLLPLHAAIIMDAPVEIVENIVLAAPQAVCTKDDEGSLPLHLACRLGSAVSVLRTLLKMHPQAAAQVDGSGMTARGILKASCHSNKHAAEDVLCKYLEYSESIHENDTANTGTCSITDGPSVNHDESSHDASATVCVSELRKGRPPKHEQSFNQHQSFGSPVKVAYLNKTRTGCSADDSTIEPAETREDKMCDNISLDSVAAKEMKERHDVELADATKKLAIELEEVKVESKLLLCQNLRELEEEHSADLEIMQLHTDDEDDKDGKLLELKSKHEQEIQDLKARLLADQELAAELVTQKYGKIFSDIAGRYRLQMAVATVKATTPTSFSKSTTSSKAKRHDWEKDFSENHKKYEQKFESMLQRYRSGMQDFEKNIASAKEGGKKDHLVPEKEQRMVLKKMDKKFQQNIEEIHQVINDIHAQMITAHEDSTDEAKHIHFILRDLESKVTKKEEATSAKEEKLQQTIDGLEQTLHDTQKHSERLFKHIHDMEDRLEEQAEREKIMEEKMNELSMSSMYMCFG